MRNMLLAALIGGTVLVLSACGEQENGNSKVQNAARETAKSVDKTADYATGKTILQLLKDACKKRGKTVVIVTHNSALKDMADRVIHIKNGQAVKVERIENPKDIAEIEW